MYSKPNAAKLGDAATTIILRRSNIKLLLLLSSTLCVRSSIVTLRELPWGWNGFFRILNALVSAGKHATGCYRPEIQRPPSTAATPWLQHHRWSAFPTSESPCPTPVGRVAAAWPVCLHPLPKRLASLPKFGLGYVFFLIPSSSFGLLSLLILLWK